MLQMIYLEILANLLSQLAHERLITTCDKKCLVLYEISHSIKSHHNSEHAYYSDATEYDPKYCIATHEHCYERFVAFCFLARAMHKIIRS